MRRLWQFKRIGSYEQRVYLIGPFIVDLKTLSFGIAPKAPSGGHFRTIRLTPRR